MESGKSTRKERRAARSLEVGATEDSRRGLPCRELGLWWGKGSFLEGGQHHPRMEELFCGRALTGLGCEARAEEVASQVWGWPGWPVGVEPVGTGGSLTYSPAGSPQNPLNERRVQQMDKQKPGQEEAGGEGAPGASCPRDGEEMGERLGDTPLDGTKPLHRWGLEPRLCTVGQADTDTLTRASPARWLLTHRGQGLLPRSPVHFLHPAGDRAAVRFQEAGGAGQPLPQRRAKRMRLLRRTLDHAPACLSLCSQLSDRCPCQGPTGRNRHLSPLAIHSDLDCPQHPERSLEEMGLCGARLWSLFTATPCPKTHPLLGCALRKVCFWLCTCHQAPSLGESLLSREGLQPQGQDGGGGWSVEGQSRPVTAGLARSVPRMPLASWPPDCTPFQA